MTIDLIDDLSAVRRDWEDLWARVPGASPFQHPAWVVPWSQTYAPGRCRLAALWSGRRLRALLAAFVWDGALLLAGTGPSDHASALFEDGAIEESPRLVDAIALITPEPFDRIDLRQLPRDGLDGGQQDDEPCVVLELEGNSGMDHASSRTRSTWRYAIRRIEREGGTLGLVGADEATQAAEDLQRLHSLRWRAQGEDGVLAGDLARRHLRAAIPELARAGLLRMHRLRIGETTIAILFAMRGGRSTVYYLSGFDPAWAKLSPGTALVGAAIAQASKESCSEFDFLRGQEDYKYRWGAKDRPMGRRLVTVPALESEAACA